MSLLFIGGIIGGLWMVEKLLNTNAQIQIEKNVIPSAPPKPNVMSKFITGVVKDTLFNYGGTVLFMNNVRVSKIHVYNPNQKKVDGKIVIFCNDKEIFNQKMKNQWVDTRGILLHNACIKIETKDKIPLEYTIHYLDMHVPHKHEMNMLNK